MRRADRLKPEPDTDVLIRCLSLDDWQYLARDEAWQRSVDRRRRRAGLQLNEKFERVVQEAGLVELAGQRLWRNGRSEHGAGEIAVLRPILDYGSHPHWLTRGRCRRFPDIHLQHAADRSVVAEVFAGSASGENQRIRFV